MNQQGWFTLGDINGNDRVDTAVMVGVALDLTGRGIATYLTAGLGIDFIPNQPRSLRQKG